jgi:hypothetical protein
MGARVSAGRETLTVFLPTVQLERMLENLAVRKEIAVFFCRVTDYRSVQVKGEARAVREAAASEHAHLAAYQRDFMDQCAAIGMKRELVARMSFWPATAVELFVRELYQQTPGPQAGAPWPRP